MTNVVVEVFSCNETIDFSISNSNRGAFHREIGQYQWEEQILTKANYSLIVSALTRALVMISEESVEDARS